MSNTDSSGIVRTSRRRFVLWILIPTALLAFAFWRSLAGEPEILPSDTVVAVKTPETEQVATTAPSPAGVEVPTLESLLVGSWRDNFHGVRTFEFLPEGQGTMRLELDSVGQLLYGKEVLFRFDWKLEGRDLKLSMTGGEPKGTAETLGKLFGSSFVYTLDTLDEQTLAMRSGKGKVFRLKAVDDSPESSSGTIQADKDATRNAL